MLAEIWGLYILIYEGGSRSKQPSYERLVSALAWPQVTARLKMQKVRYDEADGE